MNEDLQRWNDVASSWAASTHREFRPLLIAPAIEELAGSMQGKKVLDAGCGDGVFSKIFAEAGAEVTGIDGSENMIVLAARNNPSLKFSVADLLGPLPFEDSSFDFVVSILILMSLSEIQTFLKQAHRLIKPGGCVLIAVKHPAFADPTMKLYKTLWQKLLRANPYGLAETYFDKASGRKWESNKQARQLPYYHRTIAQYSQEFRDAGFVISEISEPNQLPAAYLQKHPKMEYAQRLPRFMIFKLNRA